MHNCHCFSWRRASPAVGRASKFPEARYNAITARREPRPRLKSRGWLYVLEMLEGLHGYKSRCQRCGRGACGDARQPKRSGKSGSRVRALPLKSTTFDRCLPPSDWTSMLLMVPSTQARREPRPRRWPKLALRPGSI